VSRRELDIADDWYALAASVTGGLPVQMGIATGEAELRGAD
jgi:hypothetical protein